MYEHDVKVGGAAEVAVQKNNGTFSIAYFTLRRPGNPGVEFGDDRVHDLHVFTHAIGCVDAVRFH